MPYIGYESAGITSAAKGTAATTSIGTRSSIRQMP
jgi:hypothetical protein